MTSLIRSQREDHFICRFVEQRQNRGQALRNFGIGGRLTSENQHAVAANSEFPKCLTPDLPPWRSVPPANSAHSVIALLRLVGEHVADRISEFNEDFLMSSLAMELDTKLKCWDAVTSQEVANLVSQIIELADSDSLDLLRSRAVEQEVLDLLDDSPTQTR